MLSVLVWLPIGLLAWVYVGYPAVVMALGRARPLILREDDPLPTLSIAVAVHDGHGEIGDRLRDALAQSSETIRIVEILVGSDGSLDGTDDVVTRMEALDPRIKLFSFPRRGQTATQHDLITEARGDIVVLTDVETRFLPGCLEALAIPFRDRRVGCATGRLEWRAVGATATSRNEGLYWRYERAVRSLESRAGMLTAVTGAVLAIRRSAYHRVPPSASMDHLLPLYVCAEGGRVIFQADAVATDRPISGLREQFANRRRTAARGIVANASMVTRLAPWRRPRAALAVWSHKLLRWATPVLAALAVGGATVLAFLGQPAYLVIPLIGLMALTAAGIAHLLIQVERRPPAPLAFARALFVVNAAFAAAWLDVMRGRRIEAWQRVDATAER